MLSSMGWTCFASLAMRAAVAVASCGLILIWLIMCDVLWSDGWMRFLLVGRLVVEPVSNHYAIIDFAFHLAVL